MEDEVRGKRTAKDEKRIVRDKKKMAKHENGK